MSTHSRLAELAELARRGNSSAASELARRLDETLDPIVRRALNGSPSPLSSQIRATAVRLTSPDRPMLSPALREAIRATLIARMLARLRTSTLVCFTRDTLVVDDLPIR